MKLFARDGLKRVDGLTYIEVLIGLALLGVIMAAVFGFVINTSRTAKAEAAGREMLQAARVAVDELSFMLEQAGYGIDRSETYNASMWQPAVVYAGAHAVAFNADFDFSLGPTNTTLTFPTGESYTGGGTGAVQGAETYVFTLDANGDDNITLADRTDAETGSYNPANFTDNPQDFALFRRSYGYDGSAYVSQTSPLVAYLFTNAVDSVQFADTTIPEPVFSYWLAEDLNANNLLDPGECANDVIGSCPPTGAPETWRAPVLYLWGDTDFDGELSQSERDDLRTMAVGSAGWPKNPLVSAGAYESTTLTANVDPTDSDAYVLSVDDGTKFASGAHIGLGSETFVVEMSTAGSVVLSSDPVDSHSSGDTLQVLPGTLLRAIRAIQVNFTAISPIRDSADGKAPIGTSARKTRHKMDYRTMTLQRTVELANLDTAAQFQSAAASTPPACPLNVAVVCGGSPLTSLTADSPSTVPLTFKVTDDDGNPVTGIAVQISNTDPSIGSLRSASAVSDASGLAAGSYIPSATPGVDTVEAAVVCMGEDMAPHASTDSVDITTRIVDLQSSDLCRTTLTGKTSGQSNFTLEVRDENGIVPSVPVGLSLEIDPDYLPTGAFVAALRAGGNLGAATPSSGTGPHAKDTRGSGTLTGDVTIIADPASEGARVNLIAETATSACSSYGATVVQPFTFYRLVLDSEVPSSGCVESSPCTIPPYADPAPRVSALLTVAGQAVPNAEVQFTTIDSHGPPDDPPAESILYPKSLTTTDGTGEARVEVYNNESPSILASNPLVTIVDASSSGDPAVCGSSTIESVGSRLKFIFDGPVPVPECNVAMAQAWLILPDPGKPEEQCMHLQNMNAPGGCALSLTGIRLELYLADGLTLDSSQSIKRIEGGAISSTASCDDSDNVKLFDEDCNSGNPLLNGQRWDFVYCEPPESDVDPQLLFVLDRVEWENDVFSGRRLRVTAYFDCAGTCTSTGLERTFELTTP